MPLTRHRFSELGCPINFKFVAAPRQTIKLIGAQTGQLPLTRALLGKQSKAQPQKRRDAPKFEALPELSFSANRNSVLSGAVHAARVALTIIR